MAKPSIEHLSLKQLTELAAEIQASLAESARNEKLALRAKFKELAAEAGFALEDVIGARAGRRGGGAGTADVKYRNPDNSDETWTGRGRMPNWLKEKLSKRGAKIDEFVV